MPLVTAAPAAATPSEVWVELRTAEDRARAHAAGFGWAEGQDGWWYRLDGTGAMADAAGLRWRVDAAAFPDDTWAPTLPEVEARLAAMVGPAASLIQIGESVLGEPILALRIGEGSRALRLLGGHHGDEASSVEVALAVAESFTSGAAALPADTELWVVPVVNPDGLAAGTRANANGVDLNRNYAYEWDASERNAGDAPFSEPETRAVRALARARSFDAGLSLHAGATNLGWVWNWTADERPAEERLLVDLADTYAEQCGAPGFWTTNGADWYVTHGDTTDWTYGRWGAYDYTLELTQQKSPPEDEVDTYVAWHDSAIVAWLQQPADVRARVVDATTGEPIAAVVTGAGVAPLSTPDGALARWVDPATDLSTWSVSAPGYISAALTTETRLTPARLSTALPSPRLLSRGGGPTQVSVTGGGGLLTLRQPGEPDVELSTSTSGSWLVDPLLLAPGAWTVETDAGVNPRALFVGEADDRVALSDAALADGVLTLDGEGFASGAEAWSIGGAARAPHPLVRLSETSTRLVFTLDGADEDVLVWVNGAWLSAVNLQQAPTIDDTPPPERAVVDDHEDEPLDPHLTAIGACSSGGAGGASAEGPFLLALLLLRRRRTRATSSRDASGLP